MMTHEQKLKELDSIKFMEEFYKHQSQCKCVHAYYINYTTASQYTNSLPDNAIATTLRLSG